VRNNSAQEKIWRASRPFLFGFTVFVSCALASFAAAQTSFSRLNAYLVAAVGALLAADKPTAQVEG
jgi:hypothetical protein